MVSSSVEIPAALQPVVLRGRKLFGDDIDFDVERSNHLFYTIRAKRRKPREPYYGNLWGECFDVSQLHDRAHVLSRENSLIGKVLGAGVRGQRQPFSAGAFVDYWSMDREQWRTGKRGSIYRVTESDGYFCWLTEVDLDDDDADGETYMENVERLHESLRGLLLARKTYPKT